MDAGYVIGYIIGILVMLATLGTVVLYSYRMIVWQIRKISRKNYKGRHAKST